MEKRVQITGIGANKLAIDKMVDGRWVLEVVLLPGESYEDWSHSDLQKLGDGIHVLRSKIHLAGAWDR